MYRSTPVFASALVLMLAACGLDDRPSGVGALGMETLDVEEVSTTLPSATDVDPPVVGSEFDGVVDEIETLVEPTIERPSTVAVVGDSLTKSAEDEIVRSLVRRGLHVLAVDGLESRRMSRGGSSLPPGTDAVGTIASTVEPGVWVIALGTNDVASDESLDDFRAEMREVLDLIPADDPVIWVDLWIAGREEVVARANRMIRVELERRDSGSAVVDWYSHGTEAGIITEDGVHLTQSGQDLFADSIATSVDVLFAN